MSLDDSMLAQLNTAIKARPELNRWVVAFSGGVDSTVLLHLVCKANQQLNNPLAITALHINHQLSDFADQWQQHCEQVAVELNIPIVSESVTVKSSGQGIEAAARESRYRVFEHFLKNNDALLMGHHLDDQAETLLLRLVRGTGTLGLTGIPYERTLGYSSLIRPLLHVSRKQLLDYAEHHKLTWVEDESNQLDNFDRNFLRNTIMPLLNKRWPQVNKQFAKAATLSTQTQGLLRDLAESDLNTLNQKQERYGVSIDWSILQHLNYERMTNVIRYWCEQQSFELPDIQQVKQIQEQFFDANSISTSSIVSWGNVEIRYFNHRLYLMKTLPRFLPKLDSIEWKVKGSIDLGTSQIMINEQAKKSLQLPAYIFDKKIEIRWRVGGERCTPQGRSGSQTLKKLLQEYQLETWLRDRVPLLYSEGQLVAVGDLWVCKEFSPKASEEQITIVWRLDEKNKKRSQA